MAISFNELGLNINLIEGLKKAGIFEPTDIQAATIPRALQNKDIIGQSQTGSGKTLAYLLPIFQKLDTNRKEMQAIVLAPTHELVMQVYKQIKLLADNAGLPVTYAAVIGEVNILRQIEKLRDKPHIIVGSTGRILELIKKKKINAHTVKIIVIDEGDKLLDHNNITGVKEVIKTTMRDRQLMVFSANINEETLIAAKGIMQGAEIVKINFQKPINQNITHIYFTAEQRDKFEMLRKLLAAMKPQKAFVFINKSEWIKETTPKLQYHHHKVYELYGQSSKEERQKAIEGFRKGEIQILVASDIAARGLDIEGVTHIFNLDLPEDVKEYLHRVGRAARSGEPGTAVSIVTEREKIVIKKLEKKFNIVIEKKEVYKGLIMEPAKVKHSRRAK